MRRARTASVASLRVFLMQVADDTEPDGSLGQHTPKEAIGTGWRDGIAWTDIAVVRIPAARIRRAPAIRNLRLMRTIPF